MATGGAEQPTVGRALKAHSRATVARSRQASPFQPPIRNRPTRNPPSPSRRPPRQARSANVVDRLLGRGGRHPEASLGTEQPEDPKTAGWARVQLARSLKRPHSRELVAARPDEFVGLRGDRPFGQDAA